MAQINKQKPKHEVTVIGAGLAGSEASYQLLKKGFRVHLYEMRGVKNTEAHQTTDFSELICSNSLRASSLENAVGILKEEMRMLDSLIMEAAVATKVEAGGALAVDRNHFSQYITNKLKNHSDLIFHNEEVVKIPSGPVIIATGPLTSKAFSETLGLMFQDNLYFFDCVAPIVDASTINYDIVYEASRYGKGEPSYLNCPMTKEEFDKFYDYLVQAERVIPKDFEMKVFEGCMPIEEIAQRGRETLLFGPMKPVGLIDSRTNRKAYAVVQLRIDNADKTMYNIVGFQTHLKYKAQEELLKLILGLEKAVILRYGVMHRNTYINSPKYLNANFHSKLDQNLWFVGQMTGVEGYVESAASGLIGGISCANFLLDNHEVPFPAETALGTLGRYVSTLRSDYVPMNINFGIFPQIDCPKMERKRIYQVRALTKLAEFIKGDFGRKPFILHDQHVHSRYSMDSKEDLQNYHEHAKELGLTYFITTDHFDYSIPSRPEDWLVDFGRLMTENAEFSGISLLGVELGIRLDRYNEQKALLRDLPLDLINLSVHDDGVNDYYYPETYETGCLEMLKSYFKQIIKVLKTKPDFDCLSHFDYGFKAAFKVDNSLRLEQFEDDIKEIFHLIIKRNKALEVNMKVQSEINIKGFSHTEYFLKLYHSLGGRLLTLSSDCHRLRDYKRGYDDYVKIVKDSGFRDLTYFVKRVPLKYPLNGDSW